MIAPGTHPGLTMAEYLGLEALSASIVRAVVDRCPAAAWHESWLNPGRVPDFNDASDAGTIAHEILLEGSNDCVQVIDPNEYPAKTTGAIPDGWTNVGIRAARDAARAAGKIPILPKDWTVISAMVDSARRYIDGLRRTEPAIWKAFQPGGGDSELTMVWDEYGIPCRMRSDRIARERDVIVDPKFTARSAEPGSWGRSQLFSMGYHVSAAWYRRGVKELCGVVPDYLFLVVECESPYLCSLVGLEPSALALGARKVVRGLELWRECVEKNHFPAYPNRVAYVEAPAWELMREEGADAQGIPYDVSKLFKKSEVHP